MSDHFISLNRGEQGLTSTDFTTGTASAFSKTPSSSAQPASM
jgi:hypothetical protein